MNKECKKKILRSMLVLYDASSSVDEGRLNKAGRSLQNRVWVALLEQAEKIMEDEILTVREIREIVGED